MPVSLSRAKACAARLAPKAGGAVDMSDFLLHEAMAQLQLALLGLDEEFMEATNRAARMTFMQHPEAPVGKLSEAMAAVMKHARADKSLRLPSDPGGCPVRGPLARALQRSNFGNATDYGNALLILFAGHDTTGHAMTWLLFELARHPEHQAELQREVDSFFERLAGADPVYSELARLSFLDRCVTETLRLWNSVPNGTFRQLQFDDHVPLILSSAAHPGQVRGDNGQPVRIPKGTLVNVVTWSRHRNPALWGPTVDLFNPHREFEDRELSHVGCPAAGINPESARFSPFVHSPRSCLGRNFAMMEMRLIIAYLVRQYKFSLAPPYDQLQHVPTSSTVPAPAAFRGVNLGTMGPMDLEGAPGAPWGKWFTTGLKLKVDQR